MSFSAAINARAGSPRWLLPAGLILLLTGLLVILGLPWSTWLKALIAAGTMAYFLVTVKRFSGQHRLSVHVEPDGPSLLSTGTNEIPLTVNRAWVSQRWITMKVQQAPGYLIVGHQHNDADTLRRLRVWLRVGCQYGGGASFSAR